MKRVISLTLVLLMLVCMICSCDFLPEEIKLCNVNFYVDGELYTTKSVIIGQTVSMPKAPQKEKEIFVGWFVDGVFSYEYDFSSVLIGDIDLYAMFTLDAVALTNMITTKTMRSLVKVVNKSYNTAMGGLIETEYSISQGSGVVIDISSGYAFVLTNYHVAEMTEGYSHQKIIVEDPWGNEYEAKVYKNKYTSLVAMDKDYDLAILYFKYSPTDDIILDEIAIADDPEVGEYVVSLGSPNAQKNSITYGKVLSYQELAPSEDGSSANVTFDIIFHSALIDHGSSGGPLLNASGKLVGLNFAGFESNHYGCAIPLSKINEFMNTYVYVE